MNGSTQKELLELYLSNVDIISEGFPTGINAARAGYLETFNILSLPTKRDEKYRHCDLQKAFEGDWEYYFTPTKSAVREPFPVDGYRVEVHNGFCDDTSVLTVLENGVAYGSLRAAAVQMEDVVLRYYNSLADNDGESIVALNSAFMQDGAFVYVPEGVSVDMPFILSFDYSTQEAAQMCFARTLIVVEDYAKADMVIEHATRDESKFLINHVSETHLGRGAKLNMTEISDINTYSVLALSTYQTQWAHSDANVLNLWLKGGITRVNSSTKLAGEDCDSTMWGLYLGAGDELTDVNVSVEHLVADCRSFEQVKGVVGANAVGAFRGKVYVAIDAQRTSALQQSRNLQLSPSARVFTEPQLEIYADDVKCSHGATVGQLDSDSIYYMRQRGLSEQDAKKLQMYGFVNDVISHCTLSDACEWLRERTVNRIEEL